MDAQREGTLVKYILPENSSNVGQTRPALIVKDLSSGNDQLVNLQVFADPDDGKQYASGMVYAKERKYSENREPGTWHF